MNDHHLRIGVAGHRLEKLVDADCPLLRSRIGEAIGALCGSSYPPEVVTSLAEGSDRLIAEVALESGCDLIALLPFDAATFEADFPSPSSIARFHNLLQHAHDVVELDGNHATEETRRQAYAAAAVAVAQRTSGLLAIWDGEPGFGPGSTANQVTDAIAHGKPVLWIHSEQPHVVKLLGEANWAPVEWREISTDLQESGA